VFTTKNKREVSLDSQTLAILKIQADREGRKLKNYMEHILQEKANNFELTDEYKAMMDEMLEKHYSGKLNYTSWEDFKVEISR
jgi:3-isopropylmalate dehydratase small subunit